MMYYADHHGFPIVSFIDTPGAYADLKSEELGQVCVDSFLSFHEIILSLTNYSLYLDPGRSNSSQFKDYVWAESTGYFYCYW